MSTQVTHPEPVKQSDGSYAYRGWTITRINSKRWELSNEQRADPVVTDRLAKAVVEVDRLEDQLATARQAAERAATKKSKRTSSTAHKVSTNERTKGEQLLGNKITREMVLDIRRGWDALPGAGKVQYYIETSQRLGLGLETVAKIARRNIYGPDRVPEEA